MEELKPTELSYREFCKEICIDFGIDPIKKIKRLKNDFKDKWGNFKVNSPNDSIIVDKDGNEFPYMKSMYLPSVRNEEKLIDFDYIYFLRPKTIGEIEVEAKIKIKYEPCKISEGGGWYSKGKKYFYKDICCEV